MASKDNSPAISFFSFQDIITSITGIMFLVVIMLVLLFLQQGAAPVREKSKHLQKELTQLETEMKELETALERLRKESAAQQRRIEELKKLRLETLPALKKEAVRKLQRIDNEIRILLEDDEKMRLRRIEQIELKKKSLIAVQRIKDQYAALKKEISGLEEQITYKNKIYQKIRNVIRFVWKTNNVKRPVLVECGEKEITISTLEDNSVPRRFTDYRQCISYCRTLPREGVYFVLLLKPSAFAYGEAFSRELQKNGYERGREILPDEQTLILGGTE